MLPRSRLRPTKNTHIPISLKTPRKTLIRPTPSTMVVPKASGFREKVFAIIGVKVYSAALYLHPSITDNLSLWKGKSATQILQDASLFTSIYQAPGEKSLVIVLVRDIDGKTFWDGLNDSISPRIAAPSPVDELALSTFHDTFQGRPLKRGTHISLTWAQPSTMLVSQ
ncbi:hypothetical protein AMTRI_Chr03g48310 [Amborella trichopoda]